MKKLGNEEEQINMQRMKDVIHRRILESQSSVSKQLLFDIDIQKINLNK